jgi:hypothetical protein
METDKTFAHCKGFGSLLAIHCTNRLVSTLVSSAIDFAIAAD